jgi:hypothetical protein
MAVPLVIAETIFQKWGVFWAEASQLGRLYMVRITDHVLCLLLLSANGLIPSIFNANLTIPRFL